jgi:hypothetical protein
MRRKVVWNRRFGATYRSHLQGSAWFRPRINPEDGRIQFNRGGILRSRLKTDSITKLYWHSTNKNKYYVILLKTNFWGGEINSQGSISVFDLHKLILAKISQDISNVNQQVLPQTKPEPMPPTTMQKVDLINLSFTLTPSLKPPHQKHQVVSPHSIPLPQCKTLPLTHATYSVYHG